MEERNDRPTEAKKPGSSAGVKIQSVDEAVLRFVYTRLRNPAMDALMYVLSFAANRAMVWLVASAVMYLVWREAVLEVVLEMLAALGLVGIFSESLIKIFWHRRRPFVAMDDVEARLSGRRLAGKSSFPSGHTAGYFGTSLVLSIHYPAFAALFFVIAVLGGISRVYNGVHYPSDVLAGTAMGLVCGAASYFLIHRLF